jgi:hypothetical protein
MATGVLQGPPLSEATAPGPRSLAAVEEPAAAGAAHAGYTAGVAEASHGGEGSGITTRGWDSLGSPDICRYKKAIG